MLQALVKKAKKSKGGFTLIELIVVVAILAILAAVLIPVVGGQISKAQTQAYKSDATAVLTAAQLYATNQETAGTPVATAAGSMTAAQITAMEASTPFATLYNSTTSKLKDGGTIKTVSFDSNGAIISVIITVNATDYTAP
jgi:prepilin-type N-terminal cleavage/methylation domain-containing protein